MSDIDLGRTGSAAAADSASGPGLRRTLQLLASLAHPYRSRLVGAGLLLLIAGGIGLLQPLVVRRLLADPLHGAGLIPVLVALLIAGSVANAIGQYRLTVAAEGVVRDTRVRLTLHILRLPMPVFRRHDPGDLLARVTGDTTLLRQVVLQTLVQSVTGVMTVVGALVLMAVVDATLLLVSLLVIGCLLALVGLVMPRIRAAVLRSQQSVGDLGSTLERALTALTTVKASGAESLESGRMEHAAYAAYRHGVSRARWDAVANGVASLAMQLVFLAVLGIGGWQVSRGDISVATLVAFLLYVLVLAEPAVALVAVAAYFQTASATLQRVDDVISLPQEPLERAGFDGVTPAVGTAVGTAPAIVLDRVSYRYPDRADEALRDFSLEVASTGMTALVGPSGSGKTTVLNLIERFAEPDRGEIRFAGVRLRDWHLPALRAAVGYVEQDAPVMAGTLRENLSYAVPSATDEELLDVIRVTQLEGLLRRLGGDLDAGIQYRGVSLSGGERQRVAIARALLRRPRLLLLDEVTSQLDAASEAALRDVIKQVSVDTAVLAVAHRLSTVRDASRIAVVRDGVVVDMGTHAELLMRCSLYADLVNHQLVA